MLRQRGVDCSGCIEEGGEWDQVADAMSSVFGSSEFSLDLGFDSVLHCGVLDEVVVDAREEMVLEGKDAKEGRDFDRGVLCRLSRKLLKSTTRGLSFFESLELVSRRQTGCWVGNLPCNGSRHK